MSKKLATIITNIPAAEFHEENFRIKEMNKEALTAIFEELEFKTLGKRILGDDINVTAEVWNHSSQPAEKAPKKETAQMDLFGNIIEQPEAKTPPVVVNPDGGLEEGEGSLPVDKNINNTPHNYILANTDELINQLTSKLINQQQICFDTETTGIDANDAELVGLSFSITPGEAYYVPCPADREQCITLLNKFKIVFDDAAKLWVGQNIKYDMLMLKWYGFEMTGNTFDTMLAHYVIEPDGKRNMDALSAKYLGYEPVHIEELIGKKGKGQGTMRDVEAEKSKRLCC